MFTMFDITKDYIFDDALEFRDELCLRKRKGKLPDRAAVKFYAFFLLLNAMPPNAAIIKPSVAGAFTSAVPYTRLSYLTE